MNNSLGEYVRKRRLAMGLSLREFAKKCGMSHTHIDSIEKGFDMRSGKSVNLTSLTITKLAEALGIGESELVKISLGAGDEGMSERQLKSALFGDADASDEWLFEVKKYAEYIKSRGSFNGNV